MNTGEEKKTKYSALKDCDHDLLEDILKDFVNQYGHEVIRDFYRLNNKLRNELNLFRLPIALMYKLSLFRMFEDNYSTVATPIVASIEKIGRRTAFNYKKEYYEYKRRKLKNAKEKPEQQQ